MKNRVLKVMFVVLSLLLVASVATADPRPGGGGDETNIIAPTK